MIFWDLVGPRLGVTVRLRPGRFGKYLVDVLPSIEHPHDFRNVSFDAIENDMRRGGNRTKLRPNLVACTSREGMVFG